MSVSSAVSIQSVEVSKKSSTEAIAFIKSIRPYETPSCIWHLECFVWEESLEKYVRVSKGAVITALRHKMAMEIEIHWSDADGAALMLL